MRMLAVILLTALWLGGCASQEKDEQAIAFKSSINQYGSMIRWGKYSNAANFLRHEQGERIVPDLIPYSNLKVTRYKVVSVRQHKEKIAATVLVQVEYYHQTNFTVKTVLDTQYWWWDDELEQWFLDGDLPTLK